MTENFYIITCPSGKEDAGREKLARLGYQKDATWIPKRKVMRRADQIRKEQERAKTRAARQRVKRFEWKPWVTGYIFVKADAIDVHLIQENMAGPQLRVFMIGEKPATVSQADMLEMKAVPERISERIAALEQKAKEAAEASKPDVGKTVTCFDGAMIGQSGVVTHKSEDGNILKVDFGALMGEFEVSSSFVEVA